jgi:hypothetical protein
MITITLLISAEVKRLFERFKLRWDNNIKMQLKVMWRRDVNRSHLAQDKDQRRPFVDMNMNLQGFHSDQRVNCRYPRGHQHIRGTCYPWIWVALNMAGSRSLRYLGYYLRKYRSDGRFWPVDFCCAVVRRKWPSLRLVSMRSDTILPQ